MTIHAFHVEAFSSTPGAGNPAGVVLEAQLLPELEMQAIARSVGFNETVFILPSDKADIRLRYFTPGHEVNLCGHATIAAFVTLNARGLLPAKTPSRTLTFETKAGILTATIETTDNGNVLVEMTQAPSRFERFGGDRAALAAALNIREEDLHPALPLLYGSTGLWTLVVPVRDLSVIRRMKPSNQDFPGILLEMPGASVHPFCFETIDPEAVMHARHFSSPRSGTVEDPVTGTASGVLGAYYHEYVRGMPNCSPLIVEQGQEMGRDGRVKVWVTKSDDSYAVRIAGTGCIVGTLNVVSGSQT